MDSVIQNYKNDSESVYHTWFLNNDDRLKAFRTIRKSLSKVILEIEKGIFGNDYKGSSLETVVTAISEQKQIFEGAAHAFFWKPKLRIPDIYENEANKKAFARFLKSCLEASNENQILNEINLLDSLKIKGLGPAVANILYFLQPTWFPPFNTAIVNGFNLLFHQKMKLGSWEAYLQMREIIITENDRYKNALSKDLGAFAGLLFEIGNNRLIIEQNADHYIESLLEKQTKARVKRHKEVAADENEEHAHSEMQYYLAQIGLSLGYKVWVARNDHKRLWNGIRLGELSMKELYLPYLPGSVYDTVSLIDILWVDNENRIIGGFEVEKSTSIYSGILRLNDLSLSIEEEVSHFYLVAPESRKRKSELSCLDLLFKLRTHYPYRIYYLKIYDVIVKPYAGLEMMHQYSRKFRSVVENR